MSETEPAAGAPSVEARAKTVSGGRQGLALDAQREPCRRVTLLVCELFGEHRAGEGKPGEVGVGEERARRLADRGQTLRAVANGVETRGERGPRGGPVEVGREGRDGAAV